MATRWSYDEVFFVASTATAIGAGSTVATRDLRSFPRIPGLAVEQW
jgi:predicted nucleic acid-binding protein